MTVLAIAQNAAVGVVVAGCAVHAVRVLMPASARRALANLALRLPLPPPVAAGLRRAAQPAGGCGCDGCDRAAVKPAAGAAQRVTFHRPPRR